MELCRKSVVRLCSAVCSCCKRPSTPQLPDEIPTAAPGECADVPTITPQKLPEITEAEQLNRFILYIEGLLAALEKPAQQRAASTSNAGLEFSDHVKFAEGTLEKISSAAEQLKDGAEGLTSQLPEEARRIVTNSLKGLGSLQPIGLVWHLCWRMYSKFLPIWRNALTCWRRLLILPGSFNS